MEAVTRGSAATGARPAGCGSTLRAVSAGLIVLGTLSLARRVPVDDGLKALEGWLDGLGPWGPLAFGLVYAVAVLFMVPGSPLTLAGGALFGPVVGTITVSIASNVGAALAFLIARHLARDAVARRIIRGNARFDAIDRAIGEGSWKIVALLRLSPAVPFNLQNYFYGLTRIGFWPCVLASGAAMLPGTFLYVYLGHFGRAGLEAAAGSGRSRSPAEWAMIGVGLLATVAVTVYVTRLARRAMRERGELDEADNRPPEDARHPDSRSASSKGIFGTAMFLFAATVVAGCAVAVELRPDLLRSAASLLGGPPPAELREAYEDSPGGPQVDHSRFDALLREHVTEGGWVDYRGLRRDAAELDRYLDEVGMAPFEALGRDEKLALLINAYDASTLRLILERDPIESIKSIPAEERWDAVRRRVGPHTWSLNQIEHEQVRPKFREPRIHFALVCAAVGCPPLRGEAYASARLGEQLEAQARYVHERDRWFRLDPMSGTARLTSLYEWYAGDFEQVAGTVLKHAARYSPGLKRTLETGREPEVEFLDYDGSLNETGYQPETPRMKK